MVFIIISRFFPIKIAKYDLKNEKENYILVKPQSTTGFNWYAVGDNDEYFSPSFDIVLCGDVPEFDVPSPIAYADNTYVCYGEYEKDAYSAGQLARVFNVKHWSILYPIKRDGILPSWLSPKYGITIWDYSF